jgi:putative ABC transport system permease protein
VAMLLAGAAAVAFVATLFASVRARRRDLAVLRTLGLTNGQLGATLVAQTLVTVALTLGIGLPLGIIAGRVTWIRFAKDAGVPARPTFPTLAIVAVAGVATLLCSLVALVSAALAARAHAAPVLRDQ